MIYQARVWHKEPVAKCKGSPGECNFHGSCMYACGATPHPAPVNARLREALRNARWRIANLSRSAVPFEDPLDGPVLREADAALSEADALAADELYALGQERDALKAEVERLRADAERYRRLRAQTWFASPLAVVRDPRSAVKLGHDCPSLDRLDAAIDAMPEADALAAVAPLPSLTRGK